VRRGAAELIDAVPEMKTVLWPSLSSTTARENAEP
jgi:hypothetical protein